ncbi:peptidase M15 [Streptomyces oceani]|uniref:Peptidase M15 n=2 Tax=Streptomyces oceani TaxID=1075402 RepID=A0A1E7JXN6_9ACTN|nr:D-Ala-D-Ala carboxypeptidase family metallohydrolase [Streptomyces oceani]OEU96429.1 peptidase M15 [Streptomyces oceani]
MAQASTDDTAGAAVNTSQADGCFTWDKELAEGAKGDAVTELQIRLGGYPASGEVLAPDGSFGPLTTAAVKRFQKAYGLSETGKADEATYNKIYELQDDDCSPANFDFAELNKCNSDWSGGMVSAATAKESAKRTMWKLQALRHAMGDESIRITSGFRSKSCNADVGGSPNSRHMYGYAADMGKTPHSLCDIAKAARNHGFNTILGPGYPDHDDHIHVDHKDSKTWEAPDCGI